MEQQTEKSGESECWTDDLYGHEHELRAMDQARRTTDGIHFDSIEGQAWMKQVFQERLNEMEVELFDTGVLKKEETTNERDIQAVRL